MSLDGLGSTPSPINPQQPMTPRQPIDAVADVAAVQTVAEPGTAHPAANEVRVERRKYEPAKTRPLSIRRVRVENIEHLPAIRTSFASCQYLTIAPGNTLDETHFAVLATFPQLIDLQLAGCGGVRIELLRVLRPLAPGLRTLNVSNCGLPDRARDELAPYFPRCVIRDGA